MFYLLSAIVLCLLVPWIPVWIYRRLPRSLPPPLSQPQLYSLAAQLRPATHPPLAELVADDPRTDIAPSGKPSPRPQRPSEEQGNAAGASLSSIERLAPAKEKPRVALPSYRWVSAVSGFLLIVGFLALGVGWAVLFHYLGEARARSFPPAVFLFKPFLYGIVCGLPALFLGIFSAICIAILLARLILGRQRFLEYLFWDEGRMGPERVERILRAFATLAALVSIGSAVYIGLVFNWYACLNDDEIGIKRFFALREEVHPYSSVEQIVVTTHRRESKEIVPGADLGIRFSDGSKWNTDQTFVMPREEMEQKRLLDFLQRKTGKPITRARLLTDVPGWE